MLSSKYLIKCKIYVTIEPCAMCAQAISFSKIKSIYFGGCNKKLGCIYSNINIFSNIESNWKSNIYNGILENECCEIVKQFFKKKKYSI